jgi:hypothetical protein
VIKAFKNSLIKLESEKNLRRSRSWLIFAQVMKVKVNGGFGNYRIIPLLPILGHIFPVSLLVMIN